MRRWLGNVRWAKSMLPKFFDIPRLMMTYFFVKERKVSDKQRGDILLTIGS